jgi:hypothetical protein
MRLTVHMWVDPSHTGVVILDLLDMFHHSRAARRRTSQTIPGKNTTRRCAMHLLLMLVMCNHDLHVYAGYNYRRNGR